MRRWPFLLACAGVLSTLVLCAFVDPASIGPAGGGGSSVRLTASMYYEGTEGDSPTVVSKSRGLPFSHLMAGEYRYVPAAYALHVGQDTVAWTKFDYYAGAATEHYASALLTTFGLYDGDSLQVRTTIATSSDSTAIIDTKTETYVIDHDVVTLAIGNPYSAASIFDPLGRLAAPAIPGLQQITATTSNFKCGLMRQSAQDSGYVTSTMGVTFTNSIPYAVTSMYRPAVWWDLETLIPDSVTIVEANICADVSYINATQDMASTDGFYAVLDTLRSDLAWLSAPTRTAGPKYQNISWDEMDNSTNDGAPAWSPTQSARTAPWHFGIKSQNCLDVTGTSAQLAQNDDIAINVKDVLQYYVDFRDAQDIANGGFWIGGYRAAGSITPVLSIGQGSSGDRLRSPSLHVRYQRKKFNGYAWDGYPYVMVYTTDDAHEDNLEFMDKLDETGHKYTIFAVQDRLDIANYMTSEELLDAHQRGFEIGNHGSRHNSFDVVDPDSIPIMLERGWLADILGLVGEDTLQIASYAFAFGDTGAIDGGDPRYALTHLNNFGYIGARLAGNISTNSPTELDWSAASNVFLVDKWNAAFLSDSDDTEPDSIRTRFRLVYGRSTQRGGATSGEPIVFLTHSADDPNYSDNLTPERLGLIRDEAVRRGDTLWTTFEHMMLLYRAAHTSVGGKVWTLP